MPINQLNLSIGGSRLHFINKISMVSNDCNSLDPFASDASMGKIMDFSKGIGDFYREEIRLPEEPYSYRHPYYSCELDIRHHMILEELQKPGNSPSLTANTIDWILSLPQEEVAEDLGRIIIYKIGQTMKAMENPSGKWRYDDSIIHCLAFLTQIGRPNEFEAVMEVARQNDDFICSIDFHMGDTVKMILPHAIYATGNGQPEILEEFLMHPGYEADHKGYVAQALTFIAMEMPSRRGEILRIFQRYLSFMQNNIPSVNGCSGHVAGQVIRCLTAIKAIELLPEIKRLFNLGYVNRNLCGNYEKVESEMTSTRAAKGLYDFTDVKDFYARVKAELPR